MNGLTEDAYRELYDHIKQKLMECEAVDIVRQLQELETVSGVDEIDEKSLSFSIREEDVYRNDGRIEFRPSDDSLAQYHFRPMSSKELYRAAVDMLEARLISGPKMAAAIRKGLQDDSGAWDKIVWKYENVDGFGKIEDPVNSIEEFSKMSDAEQKEVGEIISMLKSALGEENT